jgi:O-antigen ligase
VTPAAKFNLGAVLLIVVVTLTGTWFLVLMVGGAWLGVVLVRQGLREHQVETPAALTERQARRAAEAQAEEAAYQERLAYYLAGPEK